MNIHLQYLRYFVSHKIFVFQECRKRGITWRGITHDLSKLRPDEWLPYARYFYGKYPKQSELSVYEKTYYWNTLTKERVSDDFDMAWLLHQKRNQHHWQWWILREDSGKVKCFPMPYDVVLEMVSDWIGAGKAQGHDDVKEWYAKNKNKMQLHETTRSEVERLIGVA